MNIAAVGAAFTPYAAFTVTAAVLLILDYTYYH
jgi:hypothetical protein